MTMPNPTMSMKTVRKRTYRGERARDMGAEGSTGILPVRNAGVSPARSPEQRGENPAGRTGKMPVLPVLTIETRDFALGFAVGGALL